MDHEFPWTASSIVAHLLKSKSLNELSMTNYVLILTFSENFCRLVFLGVGVVGGWGFGCLFVSLLFFCYGFCCCCPQVFCCILLTKHSNEGDQLDH